MLAKRLTRDALLLTVALVIHVLEAQLPPLVPLPGVKLGLANIVTVLAMFRIGAKDSFAILICRIFLGSVFIGNWMAFAYSLSGGLFSYLAMLLLRKLLTEKQVWVCGAIAAIFHNAGQLLTAMLLFRTAAVAVYFPVLIASGVVTGAFTGLCAQLLAARLDRVKK